MNCKTTLRTLAVSTRDTLPADTAAHLQGCPTCSEAWRLDLQIWGRLVGLLRPAGPWLVGAVAGLLLGALLSPRPEPAARDADSALLATAFAGLSAGRETAP